MEYKEVNFEIDNVQINLKKSAGISLSVGVVFFFFFITFGLMLLKNNAALISYLATVLISILSYILCLKLFFKTKIRLTEIAYVDIKYNSNVRGTGNWRNYFPAGINKKKADRLFFVHQKNKKAITGFAPENCDKTIFTLRQNGINLSEQSVKG